MSNQENLPTVVDPYPFDPSSLEAVNTWYRGIRPDVPIDDIPLQTHIDVIASSLLLSAKETIPDDPTSRTRAALEMTTMGGNKLVTLMATEGTRTFPMLDLLTELTERTETPPSGVTMRMLDIGVRTAASVRENPLLTADERLAANGKLANLRLAQLRHTQTHAPDRIKAYSDEYITAVRQEARFASDLIRKNPTLPAGSAFEAYIGCLSKHAAWQAEQDDTVVARHATLREDMPLPKREGGSGHEIAHDVVISGAAARKRLQCKWGPGANELESRYDSGVISFIAETSDDGEMANNRAIAGAFDAIATSDRTSSSEVCDEMSERYGLGRLLRTAARPTALAVSAVAVDASIG